MNENLLCVSSLALKRFSLNFHSVPFVVNSINIFGFNPIFQQRHRSDSQVNNRRSWVLRGKELVEERWHKVVVGDIIKMENNQFVAVRNFFCMLFVKKMFSIN